MAIFMRRYFLVGIFLSAAFFACSRPSGALAVTCSVAADTVIDQAYITGGGCTAIDIDASVSTTWIGTTDLGGGVVTVKSGFTMTMGSSSQMILGAADDFVVEANATATHQISDPGGLKISARNITINGDLSALGMGCPHSDPFGDNGYGVDPATGLCGYAVGSTYGHGGGGSGAGGGGGAHAGLGGTAAGGGIGGTALYGDSLYPNTLGSGGGTGYYATAFGGAGGGIIQVTSTGVLTINGRVLADGIRGNDADNPAYNGGGGGAGGSILIHASMLAGLGAISANGGAGGAGGGGGGAGRVAVFYDALSTFSLSSITSSAGAAGTGGGWGSGASGGSGTTYILNRMVDDGAGSLTITSGFDFNAAGDYVRDTISVYPGASLSCSAMTALTVSSTAQLDLNNVTWSCSSAISSFLLGSSTGISTTNTQLTLSSVTSVSVVAPFWTNVTTTILATQAGSRATFDVGSNLVLRDFTYTGGDRGAVDALGGVLVFPNAYSLSLVSSTLATGVSSTLMTALSIDALSSIDASGKGCRGSLTTEDGFGPDLVTGVCSIATSGYGRAGNGGGGGGGGAAHGGTGGASVGGGGSQSTIYDSDTVPLLPGAGGGGGYWQAPGAGGSGGGGVFLSVSGLVTVDGSIKSNGVDGLYGGSWNGGGGGAGGSIYLHAATFAGSGSLQADGGAGGSIGGGGGGGGRIALSYSSLSFSGTSSTALGAGGVGAGDGSSGSIYTLLLNQSPSTPTSLGQPVLVNGSTTGTNNPVFTFYLSDPDGADTEQYRIQIDNDSDFSSPLVDYTSALGAQGTRTFQVGQAIGGGTYTVGSSGQALVDGAYYWQVQAIDVASAASAYALVNGGAVAFQVDTTSHSIQFAQSTASALESVTATSVRITLNAPHFETVTVAYAVTGGTATGGAEDYTLASGTATIDIGDTSATIPLVIVDDSVAEPSETLVITLSSPTFSSLGSNTTHTYTILDNDTAGVTVSASSFSLTEGQSSDYTVVLTSAPTTTVTITPTVSGLATVSPATLSFTSLNWSTPQTVTVTATDDSTYQGTHSATVSHGITTTAYGYSALTLGSISVSIADNDSNGGGASTASSGSASSIAMPVTWSFTSPSVPTTSPVSSGPVPTPLSPAPSEQPTPPPAPTPTPSAAAHVIFRAPPASVRTGDTLRFAYSYTNPTPRSLPITVVRELIDSRGRVVRTSRATATLRAGASFSRTISERVTSRAGTYTERVRVLDGRGRSLVSSGFPVTISAAPRRR